MGRSMVAGGWRWSQAAIHDLIRDDTPGLVDVANPAAAEVRVRRAACCRRAERAGPWRRRQGCAPSAILKTLVCAVTAPSGQLHAARHVVLDLRGNTGGGDAWGSEIAAGLWSEDDVEAVARSMQSTIEWRMSLRNEEAIRKDVALLKLQSHNRSGAYFQGLTDRMDQALSRDEVLMRQIGTPPHPPHPVSPFAHQVYLLTTPSCASACPDFVDPVNGLTGVVRVGLETASDTDYLEVAEATAAERVCDAALR